MAKRKIEAVDDQDTLMGGTVPATILNGHLWINIIQFLDENDFKSLRLTGSKDFGFHDPLFTSHLPLRMDLSPFFGSDKRYSARLIRRWLYNRKCLVIDSRSKNIHPTRVASLVKHCFLETVTGLVISNCSYYQKTIEVLAKLPNVKHLIISDQYLLMPSIGLLEHKDEYYEWVVRESSAIVESLGSMPSLEKLDIDFDCIVSGSHLSVLQGMNDLRALRLRGFDFSRGIEYIRNLAQLENLHLCHGNTRNISEQDVPQEAFLPLSDLNNLKTIHIENIDSVTNEKIKPLCQNRNVTELVLKHCEIIDGECLSSIGAMLSLKTLHFINCAGECEPLETEHLVHLQNLKEVTILSLLFVMDALFDIIHLKGMTALETLNVGVHRDMCVENVDVLGRTILPMFPSLKKLRIFCNADPVNIIVGDYEIEFRTFNVGDIIELD